jgi:hypothetical protein
MAMSGADIASSVAGHVAGVEGLDGLAHERHVCLS